MREYARVLLLNTYSKAVRRYVQWQKFIFINCGLLCTKFTIYLVCNVLCLSRAELSHVIKRSVLYRHMGYLNQSLLISLITTFEGRACEFQQFHSILTLIIINTLNAVTAIDIMTMEYFVDERIKFNVLELRTITRSLANQTR